MLTIIIPTFNRANIINDTLVSIEVQTYSNWECLIVDDGSTDNTRDIVSEFIHRDKRFKLLINDRKKGAQGARNEGLLQAKGEFVSFFDSDDLMCPERFSKQITYLENNPNYDACTCYSHLLNDDNDIIGAFKWNTDGNILKELLVGSIYVDYNSSVIRKTAIEKIGFLDEDCPSYQEWDTHIRLAGVAKYCTVPEYLISYCLRSSGRISTDLKRELHGLTYIYSKHQKLWIDVAGKDIYLSLVYYLALRIEREYKIPENGLFQKEMILLLPELLRVPFRIKLKVLIKKFWILLKKPFKILWYALRGLILILIGKKKYSPKKTREFVINSTKSFVVIFSEIKHIIRMNINE